MSFAAPRFPDRRRILAGLLLATQAAAGPRPPARPPVVTVLGDSITAGLGVPARAAMPAQLQAALTRMGVGAQVRAAGVPGDTSGGGLARVNYSVARDTTLCVVALGGNDLLQGIEPRVTKANLRAILQSLRDRRIGVVLVGVGAPTLFGAAYAREFNAVYPTLAHEFAAPLYPNILAGVGGSRRLMQGDGIHPNAAGARVIGERLAPLVAQALRTIPAQTAAR
ncbi:acyl-CoA thioesterase [Caulobacter sp. Root1455]|jgi:acyl-CoA thioesterase-1|uniref:arylesterase n=1 Tax=unclassified Caulobacter TaxID=2648921 RepID=UPI0006F5A97C|nr:MULTISPECIES: arylesterase [unclassified Caulobacter]KQY31086.1 acyl-CoA thioesterase [Caulobacter sp. Root487D2Y]KQY95379.1 acyl-CoA thioesterase [Caulobacter sp. Root1455]